ncbi:MAG: helix-turn-helix transcriptional regulator [Clostridia bacterium]|nr:helix-turn-helix transcriptional regulator [Clostridia bacterium]
MEFKDRIRMLRREAGLTQKQIAERLGVTYRTYQNYEAGASAPSGAVLARLSRLLGVSMDMLSGGEEPVTASADNIELEALLDEMQALFSGGKLCDEDKKYVIDALTEAFWRSKEMKERGKRENG